MRLSSRFLVAAAVVMLVGSFVDAQRVPANAAPAMVVDTTSDDVSLSACTSAAGDCSLRGAIAMANTIASHKTISFGIPEGQCPGGVCPITLSNGPLEITEPVTVDATTQPRYSLAPTNVCATGTQPSHMRVELVAAFASPTGFIVGNSAGSTTIRGFAIGAGSNLGTGNGIVVNAGSGHHIACNHIGLNAIGKSQLGTTHFDSAVLIDGSASGVVVGTDGDGSDDLAERNVIVSLSTAVNVNSNDDNRISGNYLGYTADGTTAIIGGAVLVRQSSSNNLIGVEPDGVSDDIEPNYISAVSPIFLWPEMYTTADNRVIGNVIGMTPSGVANPGLNGIVVQEFEAGDTGYEILDNTIVSLANEAINVSGAGSGLVIDGNRIGEMPDGTAAGNEVGIYLSGSVNPRVSNNIIVNSGDVGVELINSTGFGPGSTGNCVVGNIPDGVANKTGTSVVFENNWWGRPNGPSGAGSGWGDAVSADVDFTPWLTAPPAYCNKPPVISDGSLSVRETSPVGALVGPVTSTDDGGTLLHTITAGNVGGAFAMNPATGEISIAAPLDFETTPAYSLTVEVDDGMYSDSATIEISVTNMAPVVSSAKFEVAEAAPVGTSVGWVTASDGAAILTYSITAGNEEGLFSIDPATGEIKTAAAMNSASTWSYGLTVAASDGLLSGTAKVTIDLTEKPVGVTFFDVPLDHTFFADVEWLAAEGITRGCNPPDNDLFCPDQAVTRGQMAAFLHRALGDVLTPGGVVEFVDDDGSVFESDIEWLGAVGVTRGCNPPTNDMFCPNAVVTRGQMAAFLARALDLPAADGIDFTDDDGSIFEADIEKLAAAGITRGCNPPMNDRFCPDDPVTRAQMAAFLHRALG